LFEGFSFLYIMNYKLIFYDCVDSEAELQLFLNNKNKIFISIDNKDGYYGHLQLDKETAIKLQEVLADEIKLMEVEDV